MAFDTRDTDLHEARALDRDELDLATAARYPALGQHGAGELNDLIARLRERRDRARDLKSRQRRAERGKAEPAGGAPASSGRGMKDKHAYLTAALRRAVAEQKKRSAPSQADLARKALKMKLRGEDAASPYPAEDVSAGEGMTPVPYRDQAPSGAFDHAGRAPARQRSKGQR